MGWRSELLYRDRLNLAAADRSLLADDAAAPAGPALAGGPFAIAWRNYLKSLLQKGFMYKLSCKPSVVLYVAENKTLGRSLGQKIGPGVL